ncbi:MAG: ABC transporter ATP-binding protein [Bacteroidota bacterium]
MIKLENISLQLDDRQLYSNLTLEVPPGGRLLLKGGSGSGKTTLLRIILGFVLPDSGKVFIDGEKLGVENVWQLRQKMAYVSQDMQMGRGGVDSFIREVFNYKNNRTQKYDRGKIVALLNDLQLGQEILEKQMDDLSGGELQRLAIGVTLLLDRKIYLLDEVTSALDQPLKELIALYFSGMKDKTLIISSHDNVWHDKDLLTLNLGNNGNST